MKLSRECCSRSSGDRGLSGVHTVFGVPFMAVNAAPHFWEAMPDSMQRSGDYCRCRPQEVVAGGELCTSLQTVATITDYNIQVVKRLHILSLQSHDFMKSRFLSDLKNQQVVGVERKRDLTCTVDEVAESVSVSTATFITAGEVDALL